MYPTRASLSRPLLVTSQYRYSHLVKGSQQVVQKLSLNKYLVV